jgi:hypothetical protein
LTLPALGGTSEKEKAHGRKAFALAAPDTGEVRSFFASLAREIVARESRRQTRIRHKLSVESIHSP